MSDVTITRTPYGKFPVDRKISEDSRPSQVLVAIDAAVSWGCQAEAVTYATDKPRILWRYDSRNTLQSWTSDKPLYYRYYPDNLNSDIVEKYYRTPPGHTSVVLNCDSQFPAYVDTIAILGHNLTTSARIKVTGSRMQNTGHDYIYETEIVPSPGNIVWVSPHMPGRAYRYWKFEIKDHTNPDKFLKLGTLIYGSADTVHTDISGDLAVTPTVYTRGFTTSGNTGIVNAGPMKRAIKARFLGLRHDSGDFTKLNNIFYALNTSRRGLWIFDSRRQDNTDLFHVFGKLKRIPEQAMSISDTSTVDITVEIDEAL